MKLTKLMLACTLLPIFSVQAGQGYFEARSDGMGGVAVAASNSKAAAFANPALLGLYGQQGREGTMLLPALAAEVSDDNLVDKFDSLSDSYNGLSNAIDRIDSDNIMHYKEALISDLNALTGTTAYAEAGIAMSAFIPSARFSAGVFYSSYISATGMADIHAADLAYLEAISPDNPSIPSLRDLTSQGLVFASAVSNVGVAFSMPFMVADKPVSIGISPKYQRIDTYNYAVNANNFDIDDITDSQNLNDSGAFNIDVGVAVEPMPGLVIGFVGKNLLKHEVMVDNPGAENDSMTLLYQLKPTYTAGVAYDIGRWQLSSDLDLNEARNFEQVDASQFWRVGAEVHPLNWLALRAGYRKDMQSVKANIFSFGTGVAIANTFHIDFTGLVGSDDTVGVALQTSFHF